MAALRAGIVELPTLQFHLDRLERIGRSDLARDLGSRLGDEAEHLVQALTRHAGGMSRRVRQLGVDRSDEHAATLATRARAERPCRERCLVIRRRVRNEYEEVCGSRRCALTDGVQQFLTAVSAATSSAARCSSTPVARRPPSAWKGRSALRSDSDWSSPTPTGAEREAGGRRRQAGAIAGAVGRLHERIHAPARPGRARRDGPAGRVARPRPAPGEASTKTAVLAAFEQGLIPEIDPPAGLLVDTRYMAGPQRLQLGGDFLDVVALPSGRLVLSSATSVATGPQRPPSRPGDASVAGSAS